MAVGATAKVTWPRAPTLTTGKSVYELVLEKNLLSKAQLEEILQPDVLTKPRPMLPARE